MTTCNIILD